MRLLKSLFLLGAAALVSAASAADDADEDITRENTYFNGKKVPPILELTPLNWKTEVKKSKFLMVKHFSPWCIHCQDFAPTYQTLYEFYYTSTPEGKKDVDFESFYDFRFAEINCVAYNDLCSEHGVKSWPTTILYEDGEPAVTFKGVKNMAVLSGAVEDALEKVKPKTRPATLELPEPGDKSSPEPKASGVPKAVESSKTGNTDTKQKELVKDTEPVKKEKAKEAAIEHEKEKEKAKGTATAPATDANASSDAKKPYVPPFFQPPVIKAATPTTTPNPKGRSVPLSAEAFQYQVTTSQEPWLIKFYAPWCHHCQAMAPNWEQLAKEMEGRLNIGEVNCDRESRLCKDVGVRGYPTIIFFKGGEHVEYEGLRALGDFIQYAEKAIDLSGGVQDVDFDSFKALEEKEDVIFLYLYDHATTSEDFLALERLPLSLIGRAKLVKTRDPRLYERYKVTTWPRMLVSREGRPTYYTPLGPREMRDTRMVLNWMRSVWLPLVPELTASNAREIMDGKIVVLGILNRNNQDSYLSAIREMKSAAHEWMDKQIQLFQLERQELRDAKQLRIEEAEDRGDQRALRNAKNIRINMDRADRKEVTFAWVDGAFWQRWIRTTYGIDVKDGERVIINDEDARRYWDQTSTGNAIVPSRTSILETLNKVTANPPKLKPKLTIGVIEKFFFDIKTTFRDHPYLSMGCVLGIAFGCLSWLRGSRRRRGGHFRLEEGVAGIKESKGPTLFGSGTNGTKAD
ncbi:thioredoxin-like protein [Podospora australis]|uniref:Thioredoxin-like protein n=1 Tax=Podospora australis TaxID=1536484 RepID=A0AAN6X336_9PEZI|nr:thioredoxin-like protein [Podospora australis]